MARLTKSTCLFKVTYKHSSFFFPTYSFFIENEFLFPMIHPDHSFPSTHSPLVFPTLPFPPFFFFRKKASFLDATAKQDKQKYNKTRRKHSNQDRTSQHTIFMLQVLSMIWKTSESYMHKRLCKEKGILLQTNPLSNQEIRYKIYHEANLCE